MNDETPDVNCTLENRHLNLAETHMPPQKKMKSSHPSKTRNESNEISGENIEERQTYLLKPHEIDELCRVIDLGTMPNHAKTSQASLPKFQPKQKKWRIRMPTKDELERLKNLDQNSDEWCEAREISFGASEKSSICGWDKFKTNIDTWKLHMGHVAKISPTDLTETFFTDHGTYYEDEAAEVYRIVMKMKTSKSGIHIHKKFPHFHCSPDICSQSTVAHNMYTLTDKSLGGAEIKCPVARVHRTKYGQPPHHIPPNYMLQLQDQMEVMKWDWVDFVSHWRMNEVSPKTSENLVAETLITRVYHNKVLVNELYRCVFKHMNALKLGKKPDLLHKPELGSPTKILPLKHCRFSENEEGKVIVDITDYFDSKPLFVTLNDLDSR